MIPETQKKLFVCKIEAVEHANKVGGHIERDGRGEDAIYTVTWCEEKLARIGEPWPSAKPTDSTVGDLIVKLKDQEKTIAALQTKLASLRSRIFSKVDLDDAEKLLGQRFVDEAVVDQLKAENENLRTQTYRLENSIDTMKRNREELKKIIAVHEATIIKQTARVSEMGLTFKGQYDELHAKWKDAEATIARSAITGQRLFDLIKEHGEECLYLDRGSEGDCSAVLIDGAVNLEAIAAVLNGERLGLNGGAN